MTDIERSILIATLKKEIADLTDAEFMALVRSSYLFSSSSP
jgi:hypothetical protein